MPTSTSYDIKELCGDIPLSWSKRFSYFFRNAYKGFRGMLCRQPTLSWIPDRFARGKESPPRKYLDQFILQEFPRLIRRKNISVLDIGCGSGYVRSLLARAGFRGHYMGIDIERSKDFDAEHVDEFDSVFLPQSVDDFQTDKRFDLVISMTALEHIVDDGRAVKRSVELAGNDDIVVHVVPAFPSLFLYLWHGYRQYTPCRIKKLFGGYDANVYRLGGAGTFFLHLFLITIPERAVGGIPFRRFPWYDRATDIARKVDGYMPFFSPLYAVVIKKHA